jgi:hypothetical protein
MLVVAPVPTIVARKAEQKRKQAAANQFSSKYPLTDSCDEMKQYISDAEKELKIINVSPAQTAGAKRVRKRNMDALGSWITVMKNHLKDLTCGISVASSQPSTPVTTSTVQAVNTPVSAPATVAPVAPVEMVAPSENTQNLAAPTREKGVNWLLIGGLAIGAFLLFKTLKK